MQATLLLEDGTRIPGKAAGAPGVAVGGLCIYSGHDSVYHITDPSSAGQICAFTAPSVGTWGVNTEHCETGVPWVRGLVARELCDIPSNWRSAETLDYYLRRNFIPAIEGVDVVALREEARKRGIKRCAVVSSSGFSGWDTLLGQIKSYRYENTFTAAVRTPVTHGSGKNVLAHIAVCDFGSSHALTRLLNSMRFRVTLLPPYDAAVIMSRGGYDALILPNGAGSPRNHPGVTESVRELIASGVPMLGYGLGFHFIAAAMGVPFKAMDNPHRGAWLPVRSVATGSALYTWQSHNYTPADEFSIDASITYSNVSDNSVEGFTLNDKPVSAVHFLLCPDVRLGGTGEVISAFYRQMRGGSGGE